MGEISKGQKIADFHFGTSIVPTVLLNWTCLIVCAIKETGGTSQLLSLDQSNVNASTPSVNGSLDFDFNHVNFVLLPLTVPKVMNNFIRHRPVVKIENLTIFVRHGIQISRDPFYFLNKLTFLDKNKKSQELIHVDLSSCYQPHIYVQHSDCLWTIWQICFENDLKTL